MRAAISLIFGRGLSSAWRKSYCPFIQPIASWKLNRKVALAIEAKVGAGNLLICSIGLENDWETRPSGRQFRESLVGHMHLPKVNAQTEVETPVVFAFFNQSRHEMREGMQSLPTEG